MSSSIPPIHKPKHQEEIKAQPLISKENEKVGSVFDTSLSKEHPQPTTPFEKTVIDATHCIEDTKIISQPEPSFFSNVYSKVVEATGNVASYITSTKNYLYETGKSTLIRGLLHTLSYGSPIPLDQTKEKLKKTSNNTVPYSAVKALMSLNLIKKQEKISHTVLPKEVLEHPYWQDLVVNLAATATNQLFEKMGAIEGAEASKFFISTLHKINSQAHTKTDTNTQEFREKTIKSMSESLTHLVLPEKGESLPISGILKSVDSTTGEYLKTYIQSVLERRIEAICTHLFDTLNDEVVQKEISYKILRGAHKAVGSASYQPKPDDPNILSLIALKDSTYAPSDKEVSNCSREIETMAHDALREILPPKTFSLLTTKHVGIFARDNKLFSLITHEASKAILSAIGSIDLKQTTTNLLKMTTSRALPTGSWAHDEFSFDPEKERERLKDAASKTAKKEERLEALDREIDALTSDEAITNFLIGATHKIEQRASNKVTSFLKSITLNTEVAAAITSAIKAIAHKLLSIIQKITAKFLPKLVQKLSKTDFYKKSAQKVKKTVKDAPTIGLHQMGQIKDLSILKPHIK